MPIYYKKKTNPQVPIPSVNVPQQLSDKLGSGLGIPLLLLDNYWNLVSGVDKVAQSIFLLLVTPAGRRLMQPDYGTLLPYMIFEHFTDTLKREMKREVKDRVAGHLPYLTVTGTEVTMVEANMVQIDVAYVIKGTISSQKIEVLLRRDDSTLFRAASFTINGRKVFG